MNNKTYYSKSEDGSFHPVTLTQTLASDILGEILSAEIRSALTEKVLDLIADIDLSAQVQSAVDNFDISKEVDSALRSIDVEDMVREAVNDKVSDMDVEVSVSI